MRMRSSLPCYWISSFSFLAGLGSAAPHPVDGISNSSLLSRFEPGDWIVQDVFEGDTFFE
jgi:hypothetical protein